MEKSQRVRDWSEGTPLPASIAARYRVLARLGRGGSADVYHVREISSARELALKRVRHDANPSRIRELTKHLEREFHALAQLRHPRLIEVYDYGVSEGLPHYTMELLDGGDLRGSAPLPWRRACELIYDVASSLALLHSRRFVHRDVTPANIRCTRDGRAKLIDFGAMVPMGTGANVIGTPAYVAPEVQRRGVLDASTDLFSLGATLYFTVTGRAPFLAPDLAGMPAAWASPPLAPSHYVPEIPSAFDSLVLSLLSIEPAHRPRTAFEVMQRLAALAGIHMSESTHVSQGYLSAPHVVGRDSALGGLRDHLQRALTGAGSATWIEGEPGVGRSRLLELCTLEAKTSGASVLYLEASVGGAAFAGAKRLAQTLLAALPTPARLALPPSPALYGLLADAAHESGALHAPSPSAPDATRATLQEALCRWVLALSAQQPIVIAVDDADRLDEPTLAWLAALARAAPRTHLWLIVTAEQNAAREASEALAMLKQRSQVSTVLPLKRSESDALFASVFGAVPNVALLSERVFTLAAGNPRRSLALAQYLVDRGLIVYAAGAWSLPEDLTLEALPVRAEALFGARIGRLGALARTLAELQALSLVAALRRDDYRMLVPGTDPRSLDDALTELIAHDIVRSDADHYVLAQRGYVAALQEQLRPRALAERHESLARLAEQRHRHAAVIVIAYHRLHAGQEERALELLVGASQTSLTDLHDLDPEKVRSMFERALAVSESLGRPKRERFELMRHMITLSLAGEADLYEQVAPLFRAQLELDAGLGSFRACEHIADPAERLRAALADAQARYSATPVHERVYAVDEALHLLAMHVAVSIAVGVRALDVELLRGLPPSIEPFVSSSPVLAAIWENAEAVCDNVFRGRPERAYARWQRVSERLEGIEGDRRIATIRTAIAYGLGELAATYGLSREAMGWIERLDRDPLQRVNATRVRRIVCLQHGDWTGAERAREQAELMALQASGRQLFDAPVRGELYSHWLARDLAGVKQTADQLGRLVQTRPGWRADRQLAQGYFEALRGDAASALAAFDACTASSEPSEQDPNRSFEAWLRASAAALAMLLELGRVADARRRGEHVLEQCNALEITVAAQAVHCELAVAEARSGEPARAIARVEAVIADQCQRGVSGLLLGASYEARARIAISLRHEGDVQHYAALAARESRHGGSASLEARYGRLLQEARREGMRLPVHPTEVAVAALATHEEDPQIAALARALERVRPEARAAGALELLCEHGLAAGGYLYLASGTGLVLLASRHAPPPVEALGRFASGFWRQHLEDAEMSAVMTELPWSHRVYKPLTWRDPQGERFEVLVLFNAQTRPAHVGLAVLRVGERRNEPEWSTQWLSTLALRLCDERVRQPSTART